MSITGEEDGPPCKPGATIGDTGTGMVMAISVLGAYVRQLRTGQGEHLQLAMQDSILHYVRNAFTFMERSPAARPRRVPDRRRSAAAIRRSACIRAKAAARTIMSTSTPAAPTPSIGPGC